MATALAWIALAIPLISGIILTGWPHEPSHVTTRVLGIGSLFDAVFSIERVGFRPKPDAYGFLKLCRAHHLRPRRCIMVEDSLENLRTAKKLGMKTVWVSQAERVPGYVDVRVQGMAALSSHAAHLY